MQPNPVEVTSYQPPWKALSDFAMQSEIEQPPYQQLVSSFPLQPHLPQPQASSSSTDDEDEAVVFA